MAPKQRGHYVVADGFSAPGPLVIVAEGSVAPPSTPPQRVVFEARLDDPQAALLIEMMKDNTPSYQEYKRKKAEEESDPNQPEKVSSRFNKIISSSPGSSGYVPAPTRPPPVRVCPLEQQRFERQQLSEEDDSKGNIEDLMGEQQQPILAAVPADPWIRTNDSSSSSSSSTGTRC